jgi:hypothetical protein
MGSIFGFAGSRWEAWYLERWRRFFRGGAEAATIPVPTARVGNVRAPQGIREKHF